MSALAITEHIDQLAISITKCGFRDCPQTHPATISFVQFAHWYTKGSGFTKIPCVELLDTKKWPSIDPLTSQLISSVSISSRDSVHRLHFNFRLFNMIRFF